MASIYILGTIATFALLGWWAGEFGGVGRAGAALLGGVVGWALGSAFGPKPRRKQDPPQDQGP